MRRAPDGVVTEWLTRLGTLVAGQISLTEAKARIMAYKTDLDYPSLCYTDRTRIEAARRFNWFPSFAELSAFLDQVAAPMRSRLVRLKALAECPVDPPPRRYHDLTDEEKAAHEAMMTDCRARLAAE